MAVGVRDLTEGDPRSCPHVEKRGLDADPHSKGAYIARISNRYTKLVPMSFRSQAVVGAAVAAVLSAGVAWWVWRQKQEATSLFRRLPSENAVLLHVDVARLRRVSALEPLLKARVDPDPDYAAFVNQTGFDYQKDLDEAAVAWLPGRVYIVARGRFDSARLRQYALAQGGSCAGQRLERPCQMLASLPNRRISFLLLSSSVLGIATAPESDAALQLKREVEPNAEPLARAAAAESPAALLWITAAPVALGETLLASPNVLTILKTLAEAQRVYAFVAEQTPALQLSLKAVYSSESQAAESRRLLQGMNDLIGGLMRGPKPSEAASVWQRVLKSASITQDQNTVRAVWTLDQAALQSLAGTPPSSTEPRP